MIDLTDKTKQKEVLDAIREISIELTKMDEARIQVNEILIASASAFDLEKKTLRKVAKLYHSRTAAAFTEEVTDITDLYSAITIPQ